MARETARAHETGHAPFRLRRQTVRTPCSGRKPAADRGTTILEGDAARFPTEIVDFATGTIADPSAAWWIETDLSELDANPLGRIRLYLNASHPMIALLVQGNTDEVIRVVADFLEWDVGRTLIHAALDTEDFVAGWAQFSTGSIGETLQHLIARTWPAHDASALKQMRASDPGAFEARLQGRLGMLPNRP